MSDHTDAESVANAMGAVAAFLRHHKLPVGSVTVQTVYGATAFVIPHAAEDDRETSLSALSAWQQALGSDLTTVTHQGFEHHKTISHIGSHRVEVTVITAPAGLAVVPA